MRWTMRHGWIAALVALLLGTPCWAQFAKRVKAVGRAAGTSVRAGDEALQAAQRQAVEMACGLYISSMSETENFALVKDRILGQAAGYLREFKELRRWTEAGTSCVEIEAVVSVADFERDWAAFAHAKETEDNPRMMIVIVEDNNVDDLNEPVCNRICQSRFEHLCLRHDVQLVDREVSENVRERDVTLAALDNDVTRLAAIAAEFKADILVFGQAEAKPGGTVTVGGQDIYQWDVSLNVRAVQADSAALLMSNNYRPRKLFRSVTAAGGDEAFRELIDESGPTILKNIGEAWHKRAAFRRILNIKLSDVTRPQAKAICAALADHRGVVGGGGGLHIRNYTHGVADVEVNWKFDMNLLADTIEELEVDGMVFAISEQTPNRLDIRVTHAK